MVPDDTRAALESPFRLARHVGTIGGRDVIRVACEEYLYSSIDALDQLQPYPGAKEPPTEGRALFPRPDQVGEYVSRDQFQTLPKFMAQWVHWPERVESILAGRYHELRPAHFEGIFTLVCNFMCPHCSRRVTRSKWVDGGTWGLNTEVERRNTMHPDALGRVIEQVATMKVDGQMGIVWGGGDPTSSPFSYDGMLFARRLGITASFLTNGVFLDVDRCLDSDPVLIRISLNCGTEETYREFHGYPADWDYFSQVKLRMRELARRKVERKSRTLVGISLIIDERNLLDTVAAAEEIRRVVEDSGPGIDYVIARPVMNYSHFERPWAKLKDGTKERAAALVSPGGAAHDIIVKELGIPLIHIKDSFLAPPEGPTYGTDTRCLAYGLYGEIRHNGEVQLCSDSYGHPDFTIGNLLETSLDEIWTSERRQAVLDRLNERACWKTNCPHNSRGHHHNRIFHQIERFRAEGKMATVEGWINDLRAVTLPLGHSFFV